MILFLLHPCVSLYLSVIYQSLSRSRFQLSCKIQICIWIECRVKFNLADCHLDWSCYLYVVILSSTSIVSAYTVRIFNIAAARLRIILPMTVSSNLQLEAWLSTSLGAKTSVHVSHEHPYHLLHILGQGYTQASWSNCVSYNNVHWTGINLSPFNLNYHQIPLRSLSQRPPKLIHHVRSFVYSLKDPLSFSYHSPWCLNAFVR